MTMRIKTFPMFESDQGLNENQVRFLDEFVIGSWKYDSGTGLVDIEGTIDFSNRGFFDFQEIRFGTVTVDFYCSGNELDSLDGAPRTVGRHFHCAKNRLDDLVGGPEIVGGGFDAHDNVLMSLEGAPHRVGEYFEVDRCNLKDLTGSPEHVGGDFNCSRNPLKSLKGAPKTIGREFDCSYFTIDAGKWNILGWLEKLNSLNPTSQTARTGEQLLLGLITPEEINRSLRESPSETIKALAPLWNWREFAHIWKRIKFPEELGDIPTLITRMNRVSDIQSML